MRRLAFSIFLGAAFALGLLATPAWAALSQLERETVSQDAEVAGQAKFCKMNWRPLYRAVIANWRESGRAEADVEEVDRIFREVMDAQAELLEPNFCAMGQIQVNYSMERALRSHGVDPSTAGY